MKKVLSFLFGRLFVFGCLIFIQILILVFSLFYLSSYFSYIYLLFLIIGITMFFVIINKYEMPDFKLPWMVVILVIPLIGGVIYYLFGHTKPKKKDLKRINEIRNTFESYITSTSEIEINRELYVQGQSNYIVNVAKTPCYKNTISEYYTSGETFLESLLTELKKAKKFIFMEYFIVQEGKMWDSILEVLVEKVQEGVDVRFMYDDLGCIQTLPKNYDKKLRDLGIKTVIFNPFSPSVSLLHNNRDHRKITVIDGCIGFTGGINLADEYINAIIKHGHWKDVAICLKGDAVEALTLMFLENWYFYSKGTLEVENFLYKNNQIQEIEGDGFYQPYGDSPLDSELVGEGVYLNMINQSCKYLYINTPYLIIDYNLMEALRNAAKRGVDVRLCTPHIADKWYVHIITQSHYQPLIEAGVKIYEYTPGFNHAKTFVCDDTLAVCGTINLDYRSLVHHFECACWIAYSSTVLEIKNDFIETLNVCEEITMEMTMKVSGIKRIIRGVLRFFGPLM